MWEQSSKKHACVNKVGSVVAFFLMAYCILLLTEYTHVRNEHTYKQLQVISDIIGKLNSTMDHFNKNEGEPTSLSGSGIKDQAKTAAPGLDPLSLMGHAPSNTFDGTVEDELQQNSFSKQKKPSFVKFGRLSKKVSKYKMNEALKGNFEAIPEAQQVDYGLHSSSEYHERNPESVGFSGPLQGPYNPDDVRDGDALQRLESTHELDGLPSGIEVRRLPNCIIIGARKAGTRALIQFLGEHPQIKSVGAEIPFFSSDLYHNGLDWYISQMPQAAPNDVVVDKCAEYMHSKVAFERVYEADKNMKILFMVREPFERMVSDYFFLQRYAKQNPSYHYKETESSLEELVYDFRTKEVLTYGGIRRSKYVIFLLKWLTLFSPGQIHIVNGDVFAKENPSFELQKVERFLNLKPHFSEESFYYNSSKGYYCRKTRGCLGEEKGHVKPSYDPELVNAVRQHFAPFNEQFYKLVGKDFGWPAGR